MTPPTLATPHRPPASTREQPHVALPTRRDSDDAAGLVLYFPATGAVVVPVRCYADGWDCTVIADRSGRHALGRTARYGHGEVRTALPVDLADPTSGLTGAEYADVWLARLWTRTGGGHLYQVARIMTEQFREPGSRTLYLDEAAYKRVLFNARVIPQGLTRLLLRLVADGYLEPAHTGSADSFRLSLPTAGTPYAWTDEESP